MERPKVCQQSEGRPVWAALLLSYPRLHLSIVLPDAPCAIRDRRAGVLIGSV